jgi:hypothetical protein
MWGSGGGRTVSSYEPGRCNKDACDQRVLPRERRSRRSRRASERSRKQEREWEK